jgi:hypothetical protein
LPDVERCHKAIGDDWLEAAVLLRNLKGPDIALTALVLAAGLERLTKIQPPSPLDNVL